MIIHRPGIILSRFAPRIGNVCLGGATGRSPLHQRHACGPPKHSLGSFIAGFKSSVTKRINELRQTPAIPIWQRNYHERVIRDETELHRTRQYILDNPMAWDLDEENPHRIA